MQSDVIYTRGDAVALGLGTAGLFMVLAYIILLPGYFFYHFLVSRGYIQPVLGGFWTIVSSALAPILLAMFVREGAIGTIRPVAIDYLFAIFIAIYVIALLYSYAAEKNVYNASVQIGVIPQFVCFYCLFRLLPIEKFLFRRASLVSFIAMSAVILAGYDNDIHWSFKAEVIISDELVATYQGYGLAYLVVASTTIVYINKPLLRQLLFGVSLAALFVNGARSELFAMVILVVIYEAFVSRQKIYLLAFFALVGLVALFVGESLNLDFEENRVLGLYYDGRNDQSATDRLLSLEYGLQVIADHPIFGSFGEYPPGFYIHNALSAWVDLGLIGFGLYLSLLFSPMLIVFLRRRVLSRTEIAALLSMPILMVFFALAAKHYSYQLLPIALGLFLNEVQKFSFARSGDRTTRPRRVAPRQ